MYTIPLFRKIYLIINLIAGTKHEVNTCGKQKHPVKTNTGAKAKFHYCKTRKKHFGFENFRFIFFVLLYDTHRQ